MAMAGSAVRQICVLFIFSYLSVLLSRYFTYGFTLFFVFVCEGQYQSIGA